MKEFIVKAFGGYTYGEMRSKERQYETQVMELLNDIKAMNTAPAGCKRGPWCQRCVFVLAKERVVGKINYAVYLCGKGTSCEHFVLKEDE